MEYNLEDKLNFYKFKIEKYKEQIDQLEGGALYSGIKMIIYSPEKETEVSNIVSKPKFSSDQLLNIIGKKSYIINHSSGKVNLFRSKMSVDVCGISKALKVIESNLKNKTDFRKNIINNLIELPDEEFTITEILSNPDSYERIMRELSNKIPSNFTNYIVINFQTGIDKKTKTILNNIVLFHKKEQRSEQELEQMLSQQQQLT